MKRQQSASAKSAAAESDLQQKAMNVQRQNGFARALEAYRAQLLLTPQRVETLSSSAWGRAWANTVMHVRTKKRSLLMQKQDTSGQNPELPTTSERLNRPNGTVASRGKPTYQLLGATDAGPLFFSNWTDTEAVSCPGTGA